MKDLNFEESFKKLEEILEQMNCGDLSLDRSIKAYEEADLLIQSCQTQLKTAEKKIETLIKNRNQELKLDEEGQPLKEPFKPLANPL